MYIFLRNFIIIGLAFLLVGCGATNEDGETVDTETIKTTAEQGESVEPKKRT